MNLICWIETGGPLSFSWSSRLCMTHLTGLWFLSLWNRSWVSTGRTAGSLTTRPSWRLWPCPRIRSPSRETWLPPPLDPRPSSWALPSLWVHETALVSKRFNSDVTLWPLRWRKVELPQSEAKTSGCDVAHEPRPLHVSRWDIILVSSRWCFFRNPLLRWDVLASFLHSKGKRRRVGHLCSCQCSALDLSWNIVWTCYRSHQLGSFLLFSVSGLNILIHFLIFQTHKSWCSSTSGLLFWKEHALGLSLQLVLKATLDLLLVLWASCEPIRLCRARGETHSELHKKKEKLKKEGK